MEFTYLDGYDKYSTNMFEVTYEEVTNRGAVPGAIAEFDMYKNSKNYLNISNFVTEGLEDVSVDDFIPREDIDVEAEYARICKILSALADERRLIYAVPDDKLTLADLALNLLEKNKDKFLWSAAAVTVHSYRIGGLIQHTVAVMDDVIHDCQTHKGLDKELMIVGAVLHDVGKARELFTDSIGCVEYTTEGKLLGHIALGYEMIVEEALDKKDKYDPTRLMELKHIILSHHGKKEYGSPVVPAFNEANLVSRADDKDAKYHDYNNHALTVNPGEFSGYERRLEGCVYRVKGGI